MSSTWLFFSGAGVPCETLKAPVFSGKINAQTRNNRKAPVHYPHCDRILVMDQGAFVEKRNYEQLVGKGGYFAGLTARQRLDTEGGRTDGNGSE